MPWNNQGGSQGGGGPWGPPPGEGPKPWGPRPVGGGGGNGGGGGGGPQPPDLDVLLRTLRDKLNEWMPGGFGTRRGIAVVLGIILVFWVATGVYTVDPEETGVVLRLGRFNRLTEPGSGWSWHIPAPFETATTVPTGKEYPLSVTNRADASPREAPDTEDNRMLTGDENVIDMDFTVKWKIKDAKAYLFSMQKPEEVLRRVAESAMREIVGAAKVDTVLTGSRSDIENDAQKMMQHILDGYNAGVDVRQVQILTVNPPSQVLKSFKDVQNALQDKDRSKNEAQAYENAIVPRARGEAERLRADAEAYRDQVTDLATGDAQRFLAVQQARAQAPALTDYRLYLETMEKVLSGTNKMLLGSGVAGPGGVTPYLPLPLLPNASGGSASAMSTGTTGATPSVSVSAPARTSQQGSAP